MTSVMSHRKQVDGKPVRVMQSAPPRERAVRRDSMKKSVDASASALKSQNPIAALNARLHTKFTSYREEGVPYTDLAQAVWFTIAALGASPVIFSVNQVTFYCGLVAAWFALLSLSAFGNKNIVDGAKKHKVALPETMPNHNVNATPVFVKAELKRKSDRHIGFPGMPFSDKAVRNILSTRFSPVDVIAVVALPVIVHLIAEHIEVATYGLTSGAMFTAAFMNYLWLNTIHWYRHVKPDPESIAARDAARDRNENLYMQRAIKIKAHPHRPGVKTWSMPEGSMDWFKSRGMTTTGIPFIPYMHDLLTWAVEYKFIAVARMFKRDFFDFTNKLQPVTAENSFLAIMNSSLSCYVDLSKKQFATFDLCLPHDSLSIKWYHKITVELDFETRRIGRMELWAATTGDKVEVTIVDDLAEIDSILYHIYTYKSHAMLHNMATAVCDVCPVHEWSSATVSHYLTEGFNNGAIHSAADTMGTQTSPYWVSVLVGNNVMKEGIPMHADLTEDLVGHSVLHALTVASRKALAEVIPDVHRIKREAIITASVVHAADHWYLDKYLSNHASSEVLSFSSLLVRMLQKPMNMRSRNVMMRHRVNMDPVCAALYKACADIDQEFADSALSVGILV